MAQLRRLRFAEAAPETKANIVRTKVYPWLSYGTETSDLSETDLAMITAAVLDVHMARNDKHDVDWAFTTRADGQDLDPVGQLVVRRMLELRRAVCKRPATLRVVQELLNL